MDSARHALINLVVGALALSLLGVPVQSLELLIVVLAGVLIDVDHTFVALREGWWRRPGALVARWARLVDAHTGRLYVFHTVEFFVLVAGAALFFPLFWYALFGLALHVAADGVTNYLSEGDFSWLPEYSLTWFFLR